ncbi:hypothetical protein F5144DRAFT_539613 [Chaetomium tenue]|uniref:Uncharacterized protein n=1 Tax=Chaetomium tenue TaxID=1854479 RepID=A0ACB7NYI9_9PEZI|nr:hypothetical protein F5144DRAFT_539613 [Chaetomium globosum]
MATGPTDTPVIPPSGRGHTSAFQPPALDSRSNFRAIPPYPPPDDDEGVSRPPPPGAIFEYDPFTTADYSSNSDSDLASEVGHIDGTQPSNVRFRLGTRWLRATSSLVSGIHPHVVRLQLKPTLTAALIGTYVGLLPRKAQDWVKMRWPEWFLPHTVILKKRKPDWDEEFANEVRIYAKLRPLQGSIIPICYGQASCDGGSVPALVLSDTGGFDLCNPKAGGLPIDRMFNLLKDTFKALAAYGVYHGDTKLENFHLVGGPAGRVMAIDLENAEEVENEQLKWESWIESDARFLLGIYRRHQQTLVEDGLVPREAYPNLDELGAPDFSCFHKAKERKLSD